MLLRATTCLCMLVLVIEPGSSVSLSHMESLYTDLFTGYNTNLFPNLNQSATTHINISVSLTGLGDFDDINGIIVLSMAFNLAWFDERLTWNASYYGGAREMMVPPSYFWKPQMYLMYSTHEVKDITDEPYLIRLHDNGSIKWTIGQPLKSTCSVDVAHFPFDVQICDIDLTSARYKYTELQFIIDIDGVDLALYNGNSQWTVLSSSHIGIDHEVHVPNVRVTMYLQRKIPFYVIYIIVPLMLLCFLNSVVFWMPPSSGERLSVAVTMFLSFVVLMDSVNGNIPHSSDPMSSLYIYILSLLVFSSTIMVLTVFSLRIYANTTQVPDSIDTIVQMLRFSRRKSCFGDKVGPGTRDQGTEDTLSVVDDTDLNDAKSVPEQVVERASVKKVTWETVGKTFDMYCFGALCFYHTITAVCFFVYLRG